MFKYFIAGAVVFVPAILFKGGVELDPYIKLTLAGCLLGSVYIVFIIKIIVSEKVNKVEDCVGRVLNLENATYYTVPNAVMQELDLMNGVRHKRCASMLLDVNNVFVNARNHNFEAKAYIKGFEHVKVAYMHVAGHTYYEEDDVIIDTHGADVCNSDWDRLDFTLEHVNVPVMIERDNDIPSLEDMRKEYNILEKIVTSHNVKEKSYA